MTRAARRTRRRKPLAFTITELIIVVAVIGIVATIAVPSFSAMVESTNRSLAVNSIQAAVGVARDLALRSGRGGDGAVVVVQRDNGTVQLVPAVQVGSVVDYEPMPNRGQVPLFSTSYANQVVRDVFVPVPQAEVVDLPSGWAVAGYAPPGSMREASNSGLIRDTWYDSELYGGDRNPLPREEGNWVLPETEYYDVTQQALGLQEQTTGRSSFMIRFDAKTGTLSRKRVGALFIDPRPSSDRPFRRRAKGDDARNQDRGDDNWKRLDQADSIEKWALRVLGEPDANVDGAPYGRPYNPNAPAEGMGSNRDGPDVELLARSEIIGNRSNDTVLCKPVDRLALFEIQALARGIGARGVNPETNTIYLPYERGRTPAIQVDDDLFRGATLDDIRVNINRWIAGDTGGGSPRVGGPGERLGDGEFVFSTNDQRYTPSPSNIDRPQAIIFSISPYTGDVTEVR